MVVSLVQVTKQLQLRFTATPQFIKKRIESLIDREYLERDKTDRYVMTTEAGL
jgi:cullin 3